MKNYSQNNEQEYILKFFAGNFNGSLLDLGANNGFDNSNTRVLLELGWEGVLIEPNKQAFEILNSNLTKWGIAYNYAITDYDGELKFYVSEDTQIGTSKDDWKQRQEQAGNKFTETTVECLSVKTLIERSSDNYDFINIDCEGWDFNILKQFAPYFCNAKMISIECSGTEREEIKNYLKSFNYNLYHTTGENLIMTK
jgi:FkbM family methyltransferase